MTAMPITQEVVVDVVFPLDGQHLPRDHAQALRQALCAHLPWLATDPLAGVHPIKVALGDEEQVLLPRRARLLLRVPVQHLAALMALAALELNVAGQALHLGPPRWRALQPHATLYAYKVAASGTDELSFMTVVAAELAELAIAGERVCGKRQSLRVAGRAIDTFSLMLHGLAPEQSLRLQQRGLGPHRLLGCGIFVPHKSAAAV